MTPEKPPDTRNQADMFRSRLDNILNTRHPLFKLAKTIDWSVFEKEFGAPSSTVMGIFNSRAPHKCSIFCPQSRDFGENLWANAS